MLDLSMKDLHDGKGWLRWRCQWPFGQEGCLAATAIDQECLEAVCWVRVASGPFSENNFHSRAHTKGVMQPHAS